MITWPFSKFVPYSRNPRRNDRTLERMAASFQKYGSQIPVLARGGGTVVDGHQRLKSAQELGIAEVSVILYDDLEGDGRSRADIAAERCPAGAEV